LYDIEWGGGATYRDVRFADELQFSVYNFEMADVEMLWKLFELHEGEAARLLGEYRKLAEPLPGGHGSEMPNKLRFPLLPAYEHVLKCSHLFNTLDARGAISVTERVAVIARVRKIAVGMAEAWMDQQNPDAAAEVVAR
jgi:glycyl-tRNA synthetase alpha chain